MTIESYDSPTAFFVEISSCRCCLVNTFVENNTVPQFFCLYAMGMVMLKSLIEQTELT